ncbi:MAG: coproporphyrinogen dehydrogenase HemZ [Eubacterium sp.]|nr:coproporphyrinogen dehydrogenase HemZ [Candidatus Colimonas fimequi]
MYSANIKFNGIDNTNQYEELIKIFLQPSEYEIIRDEAEAEYEYVFNGDKDEVKRQLYGDLSRLTGKSPKWGILTGIRPVKLAGELFKEHGDLAAVREILENHYLLNKEKSNLVTDILQYQIDELGRPATNSLGVYIGIPFCPTRCLYCSFTSNQVKESEYERYLVTLLDEIRYAGKAAADDGYVIESIYMGGGTPTTLSADQLDRLLTCVEESFDMSAVKEYTVEGGRPDTITTDKLEVLKKHNVERISINPQTMKDETLELIGRRHSVQQVREAFEMANEVGIKTINADLIAGLPEEDLDDFKNSLNEIIRLGASNITVHTLAVKRASRLKEFDENFNYKQEELREQMLKYARETLLAEGFKPYYLYRQKHTSGNTENIGYCKPGTISTYNVRIMEEAQSILALGAGGLSKIYFPEENRLERVPNVSNYEIYIDRIDEMIERKNKGFFGVHNTGGK